VLTLHSTKADGFRLYVSMSGGIAIAKVSKKLLTNEKYYGIIWVR